MMRISHLGILLGISCAMLLLAGVARAQLAEKPTAVGRQVLGFYRVANSDCVVECTIKKVHRKAVKQPWLSDRKTYVFVAELTDVVVVRGYGCPREVEMDAILSPKRWSGQHVLLCCYWDRHLRMFGVGRQRMFHRLRDRWVETERLVGLPPELQGSFSDSEVDSVVKAQSMSSLTRHADVIVVGRVESVKDSSIGNDWSGHRFVTINADYMLKGDRRLDVFAFFRDMDSPSLDEGQTWIAFLRRGRDGYHPIGGCNGLLMFDKQRVYYNNWMRCPFSRNAYVEAVRRHVKADHNRRQQ
jgi:hypothetical protein